MQMIKKTLLTLALFSIATQGFAATTASITKTASPPVVIVTTGGGTGISFFNVLSADFPSGTLSKPKTLLGIDWKTTYYPNNTETIQLCYYKPYQSTAAGCVNPIAPNSLGTITTFNAQQFGAGASVRIIHTVTGPQPAYPVAQGKDSVTFRYSY